MLKRFKGFVASVLVALLGIEPGMCVAAQAVKSAGSDVRGIVVAPLSTSGVAPLGAWNPIWDTAIGAAVAPAGIETAALAGSAAAQTHAPAVTEMQRVSGPEPRAVTHAALSMQEASAFVDPTVTEKKGGSGFDELKNRSDQEFDGTGERAPASDNPLTLAKWIALDLRHAEDLDRKKEHVNRLQALAEEEQDEALQRLVAGTLLEDLRFVAYQHGNPGPNSYAQTLIAALNQIGVKSQFIAVREILMREMANTLFISDDYRGWTGEFFRMGLEGADKSIGRSITSMALISGVPTKALAHALLLNLGLRSSLGGEAGQNIQRILLSEDVPTREDIPRLARDVKLEIASSQEEKSSFLPGAFGGNFKLLRIRGGLPGIDAPALLEQNSNATLAMTYIQRLSHDAELDSFGREFLLDQLASLAQSDISEELLWGIVTALIETLQGSQNQSYSLAAMKVLVEIALHVPSGYIQELVIGGIMNDAYGTGNLEYFQEALVGVERIAASSRNLRVKALAVALALDEIKDGFRPFFLVNELIHSLVERIMQSAGWIANSALPAVAQRQRPKIAAALPPALLQPAAETEPASVTRLGGYVGGLTIAILAGFLAPTPVALLVGLGLGLTAGVRWRNREESKGKKPGRAALPAQHPKLLT